MIASIFNDVIGPVMRGPSSSHCAAALRIGRIARELMDAKIDSVLVEFDNGGSLPSTHTSQGSDMGLFGGLLGWEADDDRLPNAGEHLQRAGIDLRFRYIDCGDPHPNTYRLTLRSGKSEQKLIAISTGGGMCEVIEIDGVPVSIGGDYDETLVWIDGPTSSDANRLRDQLGADDVRLHSANGTSLIEICSQGPLATETLQSLLVDENVRRIQHAGAVLPIRSRRAMSVPFRSCTEMLEADGERGTPLWKLAIEYERARSGLSEEQVIAKMVEIVKIARKSIRTGLEGTDYADRVIGFQSGGFAEAMEQGRLIDGGVLNRAVLYVTAMMEVKSSMGVIIAAPTAGACAALPASCLAVGETMGLEDEAIAKGLLAAGLIGVFITTRWSFAAEVGGCQAEGGSAASMLAAALVTFAQGSLPQSVGAASMALQNMLGLICDPIASRVEVPCLGKNVLAASNAISCANMALSGFDAVIPLDETIDAASAVSDRMPREHRCTALGGLANTPTAKGIEDRLRQAACGGGCGCAPVTPSVSTPS